MEEEIKELHYEDEDDYDERVDQLELDWYF